MSLLLLLLRLRLRLSASSSPPLPPPPPPPSSSQVMAKVPHVEALRQALASALNIPAISHHHILIVEVCEHGGCTGFLGHNHSAAHPPHADAHPELTSDSVVVRFQVLAQTPSQAQVCS